MTASLLLATARSAAAKVVVVESHSQPRTAPVARWTQAVVAAIGADDVLAGSRLEAALTKEYGRIARPLTSERRGATLASLKFAESAVYGGKWERAIKLLRTVRRGLMAAPLSVVRDRDLFARLQRARLLLLQCFQRSNRAELASAIADELVRAEPEIVVSPTLYSPTLRRAVAAVKRRLRKLDASSLEVQSTPAGATVFLSGRYVGVTPLKLPQLFPGRYEMVLLKDNRPSRVRQVAVFGAVRVRVDLRVEAALGQGGGVGLQLPEGKGRAAQEQGIALKLAADLGADKVIVVGARRIDGRRVLLGRALTTPGSGAGRMAFVYVDEGAPDAKTLRNLGRFLGGAGRARPPLVSGAEAVRLAQRLETGEDAPDPTRGLLITGWTLVSLGLGAAVAGGALLGIHDRVTVPGQQSATYQTLVEGGAVLGVGLATVLAGAVILVVRGRKRQRERDSALWLAPRPGGAVVGLGGRF